MITWLESGKGKKLRLGDDFDSDFDPGSDEDDDDEEDDEDEIVDDPQRHDPSSSPFDEYLAVSDSCITFFGIYDLSLEAFQHTIANVEGGVVDPQEFELDRSQRETSLEPLTLSGVRGLTSQTHSLDRDPTRKRENTKG